MIEKTVIIIAGPTAVGKSALALELASHFKTEIISADSRQCFKELNIGVAKPSVSELNSIPHHFINSHSITDSVNASVFEQYALQAAEEIFKKQDVAILVGGTGLYIRAFTHGMDEMPAVDPLLREEIISTYNIQGLSWLRDELISVDPQFAASGEMQNPHRMLRALEIFRTTGRSIRSFQHGNGKTRPFKTIKYALHLNKPDLYARINNRVETMMKDGLLEEVRSLLEYKELPPLQTVGYKELFECIEGYSDLQTAQEDIRRNTRRYAKRQVTWFKKDSDYKWIDPNNFQQIIDDYNSQRYS